MASVMEHLTNYINGLSLRTVRYLYKKLREENGQPNVFLPRFGITLGQFCVSQTLKRIERK